MAGTVYSIAFGDAGFLMVHNRKRGGWEMPGGSIEPGETPEEAASRECEEESGYAIEVLATRDLGHCHVCACMLSGQVSETPEMEAGFFTELPAELAFERAEYEDTVPWAESVFRERRRRSAAGRRP